jgi:orotidine-5'-phosphate decarboxylase
VSDLSPPLDRLRDRRTVIGGPLCLGIDPRAETLPEGLPRDAQGIETFARGLIEAASDEVVAVKLNTAYFEVYGSAGWAALERVRGDIPDGPIVVLDAKRGDIGPSAERYAEALLGRLNADAVTLHSYLGEDAIEPFLAFPGRMAYVLARTSNPSAGRLQDLPTGEGPLSTAVARWVAERWPDGRVGLVVGATDSAELRALRDAVPGPGFLVPGVGAQGGDQAAAVRCCDGSTAPGLVNVSRGIAEAASGPDWVAAARASARRWRDDFREVGATLETTS